MFPLRDDNPTLRLPVVTIALIALNAVSWIVLQGLGGEPDLSASVCRFGMIPGELFGLVEPGRRIPIGEGAYCVLGSGRWSSLLTSMFMHGSWFHLIGNMWFLWVFGNNVEDVMGRLRFPVFYLLGGVAAAMAQAWTHPASAVPMVGASGAIGGVMGAYAITYPKARVQTLVILGFYVRTIEVPALGMLGYWFAIQLVGGLPALASEGGGVAFWAHVGGFVAGVALAPVFRDAALLAAHRRLTRGPRFDVIDV